MADARNQALAHDLVSLLSLQVPPIAIGFGSAPEGVQRFDEPMSEPTADGRAGRVSAGCVFWMKALDRTFTTVAADHGNCSVGSLTHGFCDLQEVAGRADVGALVDSGWVSKAAFPAIPVVRSRSDNVTYGQLSRYPGVPDIILLRVNAKQAMVMSDSWPDLRIEGKPQCHILAIAKEDRVPALSVGCMLSRVRTGMSNTELTCALPVVRIDELLEKLRRTAATDAAVAAYAAADGKRFGAAHD